MNQSETHPEHCFVPTSIITVAGLFGISQMTIDEAATIISSYINNYKSLTDN